MLQLQQSFKLQRWLSCLFCILFFAYWRFADRGVIFPEDTSFHCTPPVNVFLILWERLDLKIVTQSHGHQAKFNCSTALVKDSLTDTSYKVLPHSLSYFFSSPYPHFFFFFLQLRIINCSFVSVICSQGIKCHLISQNKNSTVIIIASFQEKKNHNLLQIVQHVK